MQDFITAEKIGLEKGNCGKVFRQCPISLFHFLPDVYTKDDEVTVSFNTLGEYISNTQIFRDILNNEFPTF